ncbi:M42 family metallopeptidase [Fundicoccus culcitae]|uniref:M42 family metallopeptidase n=1 Tax=Fundicoccus culcitae TaxID=2969821 RepID=A0ABY5P4T3_9LACT|nr:M42 family metallopeptidase [Fundicoccus culcitae]UUX33709.1 M42 family metallopeptidase [Fundicoccus culcitae]
MEMNEALLTRLTQANGISGNEKAVREVFKDETKEVAESFVQDGLGSIYAKHTGNPDGPRVLMAGHMDEVDFMVSQVTDKGFIKFVPIGGWWTQVILAQQVTITNSAGKTFHGVTGSKPPHVLSAEARKKPVEMDDIFIDIGATSNDEVAAWGIKPGDMITPYIETRRLNDSPFLLGKAWDNRIGVAVAIELLKAAAETGHETVLYAGATVQEEVGLRGAKTSAHLIKPDLAIALDTGIPGDTPGMTAKESDNELGKGPQIMVFDHSMISHKGLREFVVQVAETENIPYQFAFTPGGGTDAGSFHQSLDGIPSLAITIPVRYLHTHTSIIHEEDYKNTVKLVVAILKHLNPESLHTILANG